MAEPIPGTEALADAEAGAPRERARLGRAWIAVALAGGAIGLGAWRISHVWGTESTDDAFVEGHLVYLSSRIAGQVVEVLVLENQAVRAGDPLARIDPADYEARLAHARANLDVARNQLAGASAAADAAAAQVNAAAAVRAHAEQEYARALGLFEQGAGSKTALDAARAALDAAAADLRAAQRREAAERSVLGNDAPVKQAEAALREAELTLGYTTIAAPFDGRIGKKSVELGATVAPGQPLLSLVATHGNWVIANFKETQIGEMKPGDPVEIEVDAYPTRRWRGHVESISPATGAKYALLPPDNATGNFTKVSQRVPVKVALDAVEGEGAAGEDPTALPVGLSVVARVRVR
jgi:membrane fusion protein (multidrug efflux system)